ncbi:MAG: NAD(P)H-dependent oxidoreductase [Proteobacteria bacterium]|jgi:chromate reductase, NAD(P)H dehydrogenase (quinone)|nr:NAD(P)H-dependent oxidoreductase [Pseudomonadota bacterium]
MKLIVFGASNSSKSINKKLATYAGSLLLKKLKDAHMEILDLNDFELPLFGADLEERIDPPENAKAFLAKLAEADAIIISFTEHNHSYTVAWKNLFDWCTRIEKSVFQDKPVVLLSTSPGSRGGANVMERALKSLPSYGADIKANLSIPSFFDNFDMQSGELKNPELKQQLEQAVSTLR